MPRYFTAEEVNGLIPRLRPLVREAQEVKRWVDGAQRELADLTPPSGDGHARDPRALRQKAREVAQLNRRLERALRSIRGMGCEVKDLEMGLVDFLSLRNDHEVYLCWNVDEVAVAWWHDLESGYRGRQPL